MSPTNGQRAGRWPGAVVAAIGTALCVLMALGLGESLCITQGCSLHGEAGLLGVSFWWWGALGFASAAGLAVAGLVRQAFYLALAMLALDAMFLLWMAFSAVCASCLLAAALLAALAFALRPPSGRARALLTAAALVWALLFTPNLVNAVKETASPWPVAGEQDAVMQVYFCPTCASCQKLLFDMLRQGWADNTAFFPVVNNETDLAYVCCLHEDLAGGADLGEAFESMLAPEPRCAPPSFWSSLQLRFALYRNKMQLYSHGQTSVPLLLARGRPPL